MGKVLLLASLASVLAAGAAIQWGNRTDDQPSVAMRQQSFDRAIGWLKANEALVLANGNAALWWMLQTAAERSGDAYLHDLVLQSTNLAYGPPDQALPWRRMIFPTVPTHHPGVSTDELSDYQRVFYHAVTCQPVRLDDGDTTRFIRQNMCRPQFSHVWMQDPVCTTHQLMGVRLIERAGCAVGSADLPALKADLLSDIQQQMRWDVVVKDAYIQRVLMLYWAGGADMVKPIWLRRVFMAQQVDGGWTGRQQVPELPAWGQPNVVLTQVAAAVPGMAHRQFEMSDFHATAQGLLLAALSLPAKP
ncbi:MAG: hypothetical protein KGL57_07310 [Burkholderiales bacterium]|nr:hypothetical protein [Burkholderiales bacterium]